MADVRGEITGDATVVVDGGEDLTLGARSNGRTTVSATPREMVVGKDAGVGISVALAIVNDHATAELADGASVTLTATGAVSILAEGGHITHTTAEAGASADGLAVVPAVAITISNVSRTAQIAAGTGGGVAASGDVTIAARMNTAETGAHTTAKGAAKAADTLSLGIAVALTFAYHDAIATTQRDIGAGGAVTLEAIVQSSTSATAIASAKGASDSEEASGDADGDGSTEAGLNEIIGGERNQADSQADESAGGGNSGSAQDPAAESESGGPITIAAGVAVNLTNTNALATIPAVTVTAGGAVTVRAMSNSDATSTADGTAVDGGDAGIGVAVAITLANVTTEAKVFGTVTGQGLVVEAGLVDYFGDDEQTFGASATSGAGGDVGIAVSLGLAIVNVHHTAELVTGSTTTILGGGDVEVKAHSIGATTVEAKPRGKVQGKTVGIGASVAIALVDDFAFATVAAGAVLVLTSAANFSVIASGGHSVTTTAEAGAKGDVAIVPSVAISLSNVKRIGHVASNGSDGALTLTGSLTVAGRAPPSDNEVITTAKGAAESEGDAAIGVAFALSIGNHEIWATLDRNVTSAGPGGDVLIEAIGRSRVISDATASAEGAPADGDAGSQSSGPDTNGDGESNVNDQIAGERDHADTTSLTNGGTGTAGAESGSGSDGEQADTDSGPVSVAAAIAVNIAVSSSLATISDGLTVTTNGSVTVRSSANSDGKALANGKAKTKGGSVGVAAAVAVNVLTVDNRATIGEEGVTGLTTVSGNGVSIEALMTGSGNDQVRRYDTGDEPGIADDEWIVVESGDELPEIELYQYTAAASDDDDAMWERVPSGDELPTGAAAASLDSGDAFELTEQDGTNAPGVYTWNGSAWAAHGAAIDQDSEFPANSLGIDIGFPLPGDPQDNDLFKLDPADDAYFNLTEQDGTNAPGVYEWNETTNEWDLVTAAASIPTGAFLPGSAGSSDPTPSDNALYRLSEHESAATTLAGAGSDDVGVGGAVSVNIVTVTTLATVWAATAGEASIAAGTSGDSNIEAQSNHHDTTKASGSAKGGSVGVGIGIAVQVLTINTKAEIPDNVPFSGGDDLTIKASTRQEATNEAKAGAAASGDSGVGVGPAVGVTVSTVNTTARLGSGTNTVAGGDVEVEANFDGKSDVMADAQAGGKSVAVGAAVAVNVVTPTTLASVQRNLQGESVAVKANSTALTSAATVAGASGSDSGEEGDSSDTQAQGAVDDNPNTGGEAGTLPSANSGIEDPNGGGGNIGGTDSADSQTTEQSGQGSSGVGVAASIAVNVLTESNTAEVAAGKTLTGTDGAVAVAATHHVDGIATAIGTSLVDDASANVGAGVSVNVVVASSKAEVGDDATLDGEGVTVSATTVEGHTNEFKVWGIAAAGGTSSDVSVAGSVGVNIVVLTNSATVGDNATITSNPGGLTMAASSPIGMQNLAAAGALGDTAIGAAVGVNVFVVTTESTIGDDATIDATEAIDMSADTSLSAMKLGDDIPLIGDIEITSVVVGGAVSGDSGGVAVGGSVLVDVLTFFTTARIGDNASINQTPGVTPGTDQSLSITASDETELLGGAGGLGGTLGNAGVGFGVAVHVITKDVRAELGKGADASFDDDVTISATSDERILTIAASIGASQSAGVAGSAVVVVLTNGVRARIESTTGSPSTVLAGGNMTVAADDTAVIDLAAGGLAFGTNAGVGVSNTTLVRMTTVLAYVGQEDDGDTNGVDESQNDANATLSAKGSTGLKVTAEQTDDVFMLAIGGGASQTAGIAGSASVNIMTSTTHAYVGGGSTINASVASDFNNNAATGQSIEIAASDHTTIDSVAGALAIGGSAGVGVGVDVQVLTKFTRAWIGKATTAVVKGDVTVDAESSEDILSISAGAAASQSVAVAVNAGVSVITVTTQAYIGGGPAVADGADIDAGGSVGVSADDGLEMQVISGNLAVSGSVSVGAAAAVPVVTKKIQAWIGDHTSVDADGNTTITAATGDTNESIQDTRFRPDEAGVVTGGDTINLSYNHGFTDGQKVVYYSGGDDDLGDLTDGMVYYVDVIDENSFRLEKKLNPVDLGNPACKASNTCDTDVDEIHGLHFVDDPNDTNDPLDPQAVLLTPADCSFNTESGFDPETSIITCTGAHGLSTDDTVIYGATGSLQPSGLENGVTYSVIFISATELQLARSTVDTKNEILSLGGTLPGRFSHRVVATNAAESPSQKAPTFDPTIDVNHTTNQITLPYITEDDEGDPRTIQVGDEVRYYALGGTPIEGLEEGTTYLVKTASGPNGNRVITLEHYDEEEGVGTGVEVDIGPSLGTGTDHTIVRANATPPANPIEVTGVRTLSNDTDDFAGVAVTATSRNDMATVGVSASVSGSVAVGVGGDVVIFNGYTNAWIGDDASINTNTTTGAPGQSVRVASSTDFWHLGIAAALALSGSVAVAPGADVRVVNLETTAAIGDRTTVEAKNNIEVIATSEDSVISVAAGLAGAGTVAVGGGVAVIIMSPVTKAMVGDNATLAADNNIHVAASSDSSVIMIATGVGIAGTVGIGLSVGVLTLNKTTKATIGNFATLDAKAIGADLTGVYEGTTTAGGSFGGLAVQAFSKENLIGLAIAAGGGTVGIAGAVQVSVITTTTEASIGTNADINSSLSGPVPDNFQTVNVTAVNKVKTFTLGGGVAGGYVGVAGGVDVGVVSADTRASIGADSIVRAKRDVGVYALSEKDILTLAISAAGGFVGVSGSVSVWSIGTATDGRYDDGSYEASRDRGTWDDTTLYTEGDIVTGSDGTYYELLDITDDADDTNSVDDPADENYPDCNPSCAQVDVYDPDTSTGDDPTAWMSITKERFEELTVDGWYDATAGAEGEAEGADIPADPTLDKGTWSSGTTYSAGDIVSYKPNPDQDAIYFQATKTTTGDTPGIWGRLGDNALESEAGDALEDAQYETGGSDPDAGYQGMIGGITDEEDAEESPLETRIGEAKEDATTEVEAGASEVDVTGSTGTVPSGGTVASIGGGATIIAGHDVEVIADEQMNVIGIAGGIQGGVVAVGASVLILNITSNVEATIGANSSVTATTGHIKVSANYDENIVGVAFTGGGGVVAVGAQVVVINSTATQLASFVSGSAPAAGVGIDIDATTDRDLLMVTVGVAGGLAAAGAGIGIANMGGDTTANIGAVAVGTTAAIGALDVNADSQIDASSVAVSVQGGAAALSAAVAIVGITGTTSATAGSTGTVGAGGITVQSDGDHTADVLAINIAVGAFALGATVAIATNDRAVLATMSSTASMSSTGAVIVAAHSHDTAKAFTPGGGGGGVSISIMVPIASVGGATRARVDGDITGSSSITVQATGENRVDASAIVFNLSLFGISGAVSHATLDSSADIEAIVGSSSSLSSSGNVLVDAHHINTDATDSNNEAYNKVTALTNVNSAPGILAFGVAVSVAKIDAGLLARLDGDVTTTGTSAQSVKVVADGRNEVDAWTLTISAGAFAGSGGGSEARIGSGADVQARVGLTSKIWTNGGIVVDATADSDAYAESHVGTGGFVAIGVAVPLASVGGTTRAEFSGDVTKGDSLTVTADGDYNAESFTIPVTVGLIALAGARAEAKITSDATVEAHIGPAVGVYGGSDRPDINVGSGAVLVKASASMTADAEADSIGGGAFTLSVMLPEAETNGATRAYVREGTKIKANSLDVEAGTSGDEVVYKATATSKNLAIGLIAGVGVDAAATTNGVVEAFVGAPVGAPSGFTSAAPTVIDVEAPLDIDAYSDMDAVASVGSGAGGGVAIAVLFPSAEVAGTTRAFIGQGADIDAPSIDIDANGNLNADSTTIAVSVSLVNGVIVKSDSIVSGVVDAHIGSAAGTSPISDISDIDTGAITVDADAVMTATPTIQSVGVGILADINVLFPTAVLEGIVRAYVGEGVDIDASSVRLEASAPNLAAFAEGKGAGFGGLVGLGIIGAEAINRSQVEAFVGAHRSIDASAVTTDVNVQSGQVQVLVVTKMTATAKADSDGFSLGLKLGVLSADSLVDGYTGVYVRDGVHLVSGDLTLKAGDPDGTRIKYEAISESTPTGVGLLAAGAIVRVQSETRGAVEAFVGAATGRTRGGLTTAVLDVAGDIVITAASDMDSRSTAKTVSVSVGVSFNVLKPSAWTTGATRAYAGDGTKVKAESITITADGDVQANATTQAVAVGLLGAGNGAGSEAIVLATTEAFLGERADTGRTTLALVDITDRSDNAGPVTVTAETAALAKAVNDGVAAALGVAVNSLMPEAQLAGSTRAYIGPWTELQAAEVILTATEPVLSKADATTAAGTGAAIAISILVADATVSRVTEAFVGHNAKLRLGSNNLTLNATTPVTTANATADGGQGGLFTVASFKSLANVGDDAVYLPGPTGIRGDVDVVGGSPWKIVKEGYDWVAAGYQVGDKIQIIDPDVDEDDPIGTFTITGFANTGPDGAKDTLLLSGSAPSTGNDKDWTINPVRKTTATRAVTAAYLDDSSDTEAGNVDLNATATSVGNADIEYLGISAFFGLNLSSVEAIVGHDVDTFVGDDARVNITGDLTLTSTNTAQASPDISDTSVSGGIDISALTARGRITSDTASWIGNGADIDARKVDLDATGTHDAQVTVNTTGFGLLLNVDVLDARAEDFGSSSVRIGPQRIRGNWGTGTTYYQGDVVTASNGKQYTAARTHVSASDTNPATTSTTFWKLGGGTAGSSGNPTQVTATGSAGITADATLRSIKIGTADEAGLFASPTFKGFSLFVAGGQAKAIARQDGTARATVGSYAQLTATKGNIHVLSEFSRGLGHRGQGLARPDRPHDGPGERVARGRQRREPRQEDRDPGPAQPHRHR
jgi:hypothetical protein